MRKRLMLGPLMAAGLALGWSGAARADVIVNDVEMPNAITANVSMPGGITSEVYVGQEQFYSGGVLVFVGDCYDLFHYISEGGGQSLDYAFGALTTDGAGKPISAMLSEEIGGIALASLNTTAPQEQGGQIAIWELLGASVTGISDPTAAAFAATYYTDASTMATDYLPGTFYSVNDTTQSFVGADPANVPEPATIAMFLAGLGLLGFAATRRKSRASSPLASA